MNRNAQLEEEYSKVSAFKPLMESYKAKVAELELQISAAAREADGVRHELEVAQAQLQTASEEKERDNEAATLYEERLRELELSTNSKAASASRTNGHVHSSSGSSEDSIDAGRTLDNALSGQTMTQLRIENGRLQRELKAANANKAEASRLLILENLLEDANRMKQRYESDYLKEHRDSLKLQAQLEDIRSGDSGLGDG